MFRNTLIVVIALMGCFMLTSLQRAPSPPIRPFIRNVSLPTPPAISNSRLTAYDDLIGEAARKNHLDPLLLKAIIAVESDFNPRSLSPAGACGLTQLMPATA